MKLDIFSKMLGRLKKMVSALNVMALVGKIGMKMGKI